MEKQTLTFEPAFQNLSLNLNVMAIEFLCGITAGKPNWWYLKDLLAKMALQDKTEVKRGISYPIAMGQVDASVVSLEANWKINRKTVRSILDEMEEAQLIRRSHDKLTTIIDVICVSGWFDKKNGRCSNPVYLFSRTYQDDGKTPLQRATFKSTSLVSTNNEDSTHSVAQDRMPP